MRRISTPFCSSALISFTSFRAFQPSTCTSYTALTSVDPSTFTADPYSLRFQHGLSGFSFSDPAHPRKRLRVLTEADHREAVRLWSDAAHDVMIQLALLSTGDRVGVDRLTNSHPLSGVDMGRQTLDHRNYDLSGSGRRAGGAERRFSALFIARSP
jgi:hypothetical protein